MSEYESIKIFQAQVKLGYAKLDLSLTYAKDGAYADASKCAEEAAKAFNAASAARKEAVGL